MLGVPHVGYLGVGAEECCPAFRVWYPEIAGLAGLAGVAGVGCVAGVAGGLAAGKQGPDNDWWCASGATLT